MDSKTHHAQQKDLSPPSVEIDREEKQQLKPSIKLTTNPKDQEDAKDHFPLKQFSLKQLINKLNHLNFQDLNITAIFQHNQYPRTLSLPASPMPCSNEQLRCTWNERIDIDQIMTSYHFHCLNLPMGQKIIEVFPVVKNISEKEALFLLPETCQETSAQEIHSYECNETTVSMLQNGILFHGRLVDYGAFQFRVIIHKSEAQNYRWLNVDIPVTIVFTKGNDTLYSGQCQIVKHDYGDHCRQLNLEPMVKQIRRFEPLEFRSCRQKLTPSMDAVFPHPLLKKTFNLKVVDISGSGFAVEEEDRYAVLLPGLIIPNLRLCFSDGSYIECTAQVIYTKPHHESRTGAILRCGLVILDMPVEDHIKLLAILHQADDANAYLCNKVDMDALWDFFFETGFIYPKKYEFIENNKAQIKATYEKVYHHGRSIASHFIYQENGRITAHMAIIRFYDAAWLIHHHAADASANHRGGLMVLNQISRFINDSYRLSSMKMDYIFFYYRPDNKFPNHAFGGTARHIKDLEICSLDNFAYFHYHPPESEGTIKLTGNWQLAPATHEDLVDLETFYSNHSGGLMLKGLQLTPDQVDISELISAYHKIGLKRDRYLFALNHRGKISALVMVNVADLGLNMSDLTNCVQFFVIDDQYLTHEVIQTTISEVSVYLKTDDIPVMIYPCEAATQAGLEYEKTYCLWVYNMHKNMDNFYKFLKRLLKFIRP